MIGVSDYILTIAFKLYHVSINFLMRHISSSLCPFDETHIATFSLRLTTFNHQRVEPLSTIRSLFTPTSLNMSNTSDLNMLTETSVKSAEVS